MRQIFDTSRFGRETQHEVEFRTQFADPRACQRREFHGDGGALLLIADASPNAVLFISRVAFDVALGREKFFAVPFHLVVDVRRSAWIGHGLDGAEQVLAARAGDESAKAEARPFRGVVGPL